METYEKVVPPDEAITEELDVNSINYCAPKSRNGYCAKHVSRNRWPQPRLRLKSQGVRNSSWGSGHHSRRNGNGNGVTTSRMWLKGVKRPPTLAPPQLHTKLLDKW